MTGLTPQREALEIIFAMIAIKNLGIHPLDYIIESTAKTIHEDYYIHEGPVNVIIRRVKQILQADLICHCK